MALVNIPDETKELLDLYRETIKGDYITLNLFLDSAVRQRLRGLGISVEDDLIIDHLKRLEESRQRHLDRMSVAQTRLRHQRRVAMAKQRLNSIK